MPMETAITEDNFQHLTDGSFFPLDLPMDELILAKSDLLVIPTGHFGKIFAHRHVDDRRSCPLCPIFYRSGRTGPRQVRPWVNPHKNESLDINRRVIRATKNDFVACVQGEWSAYAWQWLRASPNPEVRSCRIHVPDKGQGYTWSITFVDNAVVIHGQFGRLCWLLSTQDLDMARAFGKRPGLDYYVNRLNGLSGGVPDTNFHIQEPDLEIGEIP